MPAATAATPVLLEYLTYITVNFGDRSNLAALTAPARPGTRTIRRVAPDTAVVLFARSIQSYF